MAQKHAAAKRSAQPPPPPPPLAASSEETESSSGSEDSEDEAASPTPAPNMPPAPPQKGDESETSDEEEEGDEEEDEEEEEEDEVPTPAAPTTIPKNQPPPPQQSEDSDTSEEEEEEEEEHTQAAPPSAPKNQPPPPQQSEDSVPTRAAPTTTTPKNQPPPPQQSEDSDTSEESDSEEEETTHAASSSAPKKQPPPPQNNDKLDASDEEGEEGESSESGEEAPLPKPSPNQEADDIKPPPAKKARVAFRRIWSTGDEVRILEALAAHRKQHGALPHPDALISALAGKLDNRAYGSKELQSKLKKLKRRCVILTSKGELPSKEHDCRLLDLSKLVWGSDKTTTAAAAKAANGHELRGFEEMCELYPYLAEEVKKLEAAHTGMFKRVFGKMDDDKARAMDEKIKKQRVVQMKVELRRSELAKEVTKAIMELVD